MSAFQPILLVKVSIQLLALSPQHYNRAGWALWSLRMNLLEPSSSHDSIVHVFFGVEYG
jgi:hypothetical protein